MAGTEKLIQNQPPELKQLTLTKVKFTGRLIGTGAYGSVEEVEIPGARVAAKKLHTQLVDFGSSEQVQRWTSDFVEECKLMSQLRHPHIVQFLGVCYLLGSPIPVLVMEKLQTSLDNLLETTPDIPLDIKVHLLTGISQGVVFLHSCSPPIAHRDLTARNILIDSGLTAKIADLGVARMVNIQPGQLAATMTRAPGNGLYMPPEAVQEERSTRYNTSIDIFSFGVISLFTITQVFPKDLKPATYHDPVTGKIVGRSEIERREEYIEIMKRSFGNTHSLVQLTLDCLQYLPKDRPSAVVLLRQLQENIPQNCAKTKLEILNQREQEIKQIQEEHKKQINVRNAEKASLISDIEQLKSEKGAKIKELELCISDLQDTINHLQAENKKLATCKTELDRQAIQGNQVSVQTKLGTEKSGKGAIAEPKREIQTAAITFSWSRHRDIPKGIYLQGQPVSLNGKLYIGAKRSFASGTVLEYIPRSDEWTQLPPISVYNFGMATLEGRLLVVGGVDASTGKVSDKILRFDKSSQRWVRFHVALPQPIAAPLTLEYERQLLLIGGDNARDEPLNNVSILDTKNKWHSLHSLPGAVHYKHAIHDDTLYLVSDRTLKYAKQVHIPTLISGAKLNVWDILPDVPFCHSSPVVYHNNVLTMGGSSSSYTSAVDSTAKIELYDPKEKKWKQIGTLPKPIFDCCCTIFSNKLFVFGGGSTYVAELSYAV